MSKTLIGLVVVLGLSGCGLAQQAAINVGGGILIDKSMEAANSGGPRSVPDNSGPSEDYCNFYPESEKCNDS
jgi:hypothetical protein